MAYAAGVDLGTTFSAAAVYGSNGAHVVDLGTKTMVMPSVVAVRADGQILTGSAAERRLTLEPSRVAREFKRRLGDPTPLLLGGVPYGAEALTGILLRSIVEFISEREGEPPTILGLSHPATYGNYKLGLLTEAAREAEIQTPVLVAEPVAAAVHYAQVERVAVDDIIAVYDLGGGTFDASLVRRTDDGFDMIGRPDGIDRFGGIDMDEAVLGHVHGVIGDDLLGFDDTDPAVVSALAHLREECRNAKEALSGDTEVSIPIMLPGLHTEVRLTRSEFEDMIRPRIRETIHVLERAVSSAGIEMDEVTRVLLVGGASRIPLVGEIVRHATHRPVALDAHPKLTTALGAARFAHDELGAQAEFRSADDVPKRTIPNQPTPAPDAETRPAADAEEPKPRELEPVASAPEPAATRRHNGRPGRRRRLAVGTLIGALVLVAAVLIISRQGNDGAPDVVFNASGASSGLALVMGGDSDVEVVAVGPTEERAWTTGNGRALPAADGNTDEDWYMTFNVDDDILFEASPTSQVRIEIEFFDEGTDQFRIEYDSNDSSIADAGRYKESEIVRKTGTGEFRTAIFELDDAYFGNRTNLGDFRINDLSDGAEIVRRVTVTLM